MTTVIHLPAQKEPKTLTARARAQCLLEHLQGFLAANNLQGFQAELPPDEVPGKDTVLGMILHVASNPRPSLKQIKSDAFEMKRISRGKIKFCPALELFSHLLGYRTWSAVCALARSGHIENLNNIDLLKKAVQDPELKTAKQAVHTVRTRPMLRLTRKQFTNKEQVKTT